MPLVIFSYFHHLNYHFADNADKILSRGRELMRTLLIGALCAVLVGCSCPPPRGVGETCTSRGCFSKTAATSPIELKRVSFKPEPATTIVKPKKASMATGPTATRRANEAEPVEKQTDSRNVKESEVSPHSQTSATPDTVPKKETTTVGGKTEGPASGQPSETSDPVAKKGTPTVGAKTEGPASDRPLETPDPVLKKAKIAVAAKMEGTASVEFVDIKRTMNKTTFGQSFEIICGHVKGKKKSGEPTGE